MMTDDWKAHNHDIIPSCREYLVNGRIVGACMLQPIDTASEDRLDVDLSAAWDAEESVPPTRNLPSMTKRIATRLVRQGWGMRRRWVR